MEIVKREHIFAGLSTNAVFTSPAHIIERFDEYIAWIEANCLTEAKLYGSEGNIAKLDRMRAPSIQGFCRYLRTTTNIVKGYIDKGGDWKAAFDFVEDCIHAISYEGAAAGLLKEAIVTRKLGLADKIEQTGTTRKVVILTTPDNGRAIPAPSQGLIEDADFT